MNDLTRWLEELGLERYAATLAENDIDWDVLPDLAESDLEKLGLSLGHRKRLLKAIAALASGEATPAPVAAVSRASPHDYTPKHLAERILSSRQALQGERKQVTVLFADIKGSLEMIEGGDPEEASRILDGVIRAMIESVHRYEGTVNKVMGDGIMALFGAPLAHEDHAVRACYAALAIQRAIRSHAESARRSHGIEVQARVGLNSGEVVVRAIGNDLSMDYDAIGPTVHLASRMEQLALPGATRLTADTLRLAEGFIAVEPLGPVPVKGLPEPVEVFALTGAGVARTRLQAAAARGFTRFVGREPEMQTLARALAEAGAGRGQMVAVVGEPGVGKSRLYYEFTHSHDSRDWLVLEGNSVSYGKATAWLPVIQLLRAYFGVDERDDHRRIAEKVAGKLVMLDEKLRAGLPALLALLDVPVEDPEWRDSDPHQRRQRTLAALQSLFVGESLVQPLILVFEDLHWADGESQALIDCLVDRLPSHRMLLLVNYRPEYEHGWGSRTCYRQLRIDPLGAQGADQLLAALLGPGLGELKRRLIARSGGNPLFLEEGVRALVETQALVGSRGDYRLVGGLEDLDIPDTVQTIIAARIDRLTPEQKQLLQAAAVIGKDFPFSILQAIAGLSEAELQARLGELQAAEFIYETRLFPDLEYTFKHAHTHQVSYGSLLRRQRQALHARIVEMIERLAGDRRSEQTELLAHHAFHGELWDQAVEYARQAGARAHAGSAYREAAAAYEQALAAHAHLPEDRAEIERGIDLRFESRAPYLPLGGHEKVTGRIQEAEAMAERIGDATRLGRAYAYLIISHFWTGNYARAIAAGERALPIVRESGQRDLRLLCQSGLVFAHHGAGDYAQAIAWGDKVIADLSGDDLYRNFGYASLPSVVARAIGLWARVELGRFDEAAPLSQQAIEIAETAKQQFSMAFAYFAAGLLRARRGAVAEAIPFLENAFAICDSGFAKTLISWVSPTLGHAYLETGRTEQAFAHLERPLPPEEGRLPYVLWQFRLAEAYLRVGRDDDARSNLEQALARSRACGERGHEAWTLYFLGAADAKAAAAGAEAHFRAALALAEELGMRPLLAHCRLGLGRLLQQGGASTAAEAHVAAALAMYRDMGMRAPPQLAAATPST